MSRAAAMIPESQKPARATPANGATVTRVDCASCGTDNDARQQFCSSCGDQLWEKCPKCEAPCAASAKYCGVCGTDLAALLAELAAKIQTALNDAHAMRTRFEFSKAIGRMKGLLLFEHSKVRELTTQARQLVEQLVNERERSRVALEDVLAKAKRLEAEGDDEQALAALERVPPPIRTSEINALHQLLKSRSTSVTDLEAEIRSLLRTKKYQQAVGPLRHLLSLRPDHAAGFQVAGLLRDHFFAQARESVADFNYEEALETLNMILPITRTPEIEKHLTDLREVTWLLRYARTAPVLDRTLLELAMRLPKMLPKDTEVVNLCANLQERFRSAAARGAVREVVTEIGQRKCGLGCGVSRWSFPKNVIPNDDTLRQQLEREPGRYSVAIGLALQGIGLASVGTNLLAAPEPGLLSRLTFTRRKTPDAAWGFDFGESSVKVVRLTKHEESRAKLTFCEIVPYSEPIVRNDAIGEKNDILYECMARFVARNPIADGDVVCSSMMAKEVLAKFLEFPPMKPRKLSEAVRFEVQHHVPLPLDELQWDFAVTSRTDEASKGSAQRTVLLVSKMLEVRGRMRVFERNNIPLHVLQAEPVAVHNFARHENRRSDKPESSKSEGFEVYFDMGLRTSCVTLSCDDAVWSRTVSMGGDDFTRAIAEEMGVTAEQAEELKRAPQRTKKLCVLHSPFRPIVDRLFGEAQRSIQAFVQGHPDLTLSRLILLGGGSRLHSLLWYLLDEGAASRVRVIHEEE
jgi:type IV pilus assembly protein PilM